jgi:hypothetical protein
MKATLFGGIEATQTIIHFFGENIRQKWKLFRGWSRQNF